MLIAKDNLNDTAIPLKRNESANFIRKEDIRLWFAVQTMLTNVRKWQC